MSQSARETWVTFGQRHPTAVIALHWITAAAVLSGAAIILTREEVGARDLKRLLLEQHRTLGILVLGLVLIRLVNRVWSRREWLKHALPGPLRLASALSHLGLYCLLIATPLLGWALTNAHGQDITLFGLLRLPRLVGSDLDLADSLADFHATSAWTLIGLVGAHSTAALWHHFVRRDAVLRAMLPWRSPVEVRPPHSEQV